MKIYFQSTKLLYYSYVTLQTQAVTVIVETGRTEKLPDRNVLVTVTQGEQACNVLPLHGSRQAKRNVRAASVQASSPQDEKL